MVRRARRDQRLPVEVVLTFPRVSRSYDATHLGLKSMDFTPQTVALPQCSHAGDHNETHHSEQHDTQNREQPGSQGRHTCEISHDGLVVQPIRRKCLARDRGNL